MGQTPEGAKQAAQTAKELHGVNHHKRIGFMGGKRSKNTGFAALPREAAQEAGRKGGKKSKRGPAKI
jgi:general stress protein YciG